MNKLNIVILLALIHLSGHAQMIRHDIDPDQTIVTGSKLSGALSLSLEDKTGIVHFEGALIQPNWILTCAHFADEGILPHQSLDISGEQYDIDSLIFHPDYEGSYHDIALIRLQSDVPHITPIKLHDQPVAVNDIITIVGTGLLGTGDTGQFTRDTIQRKVTNKLEKVSSDWLFIRFDEPASPNVTKREGVCGPGNSGGPALIRQDGQYFIVGVSSHSETFGQPEGTYGIFDKYTNTTSPHTFQWIKGTIEACDFLRQEASQNLIDLIASLPLKDAGQDLPGHLDKKLKRKIMKFSKKCHNYSLKGIQKEEGALALIYEDEQNEKNCVLTFDLDRHSSIDNISYQRQKPTHSVSEFELPPDLKVQTDLWNLPPTYVSLRISDFFQMCLSNADASVEHFMENSYESVPGREEDMTIFFSRIKNSIDKVENVKTGEFKKNRGTVTFKSQDKFWTLSISINDLDPYKINGLTINSD